MDHTLLAPIQATAVSSSGTGKMMSGHILTSFHNLPLWVFRPYAFDAVLT